MKILWRNSVLDDRFHAFYRVGLEWRSICEGTRREMSYGTQRNRPPHEARCFECSTLEAHNQGKTEPLPPDTLSPLQG